MKDWWCQGTPRLLLKAIIVFPLDFPFGLYLFCVCLDHRGSAFPTTGPCPSDSTRNSSREWTPPSPLTPPISPREGPGPDGTEKNLWWLMQKVLEAHTSCALFIFLNFLTNLFIYLFWAALGLRCCGQTFSSCGERASHCSGFSCCGVQALGARASVVVARGL